MSRTKESAHVSSTAPRERRREGRFALRLSCHLYPLSKEKAAFEGTIVNISRSGILVALESAEISAILRPDEAARVVVDLPRHRLFSPRCFECSARVLRVVVLETQTQVAVEIGRIRVTGQNTRANATGDWFSAPIEGLIQ